VRRREPYPPPNSRSPRRSCAGSRSCPRQTLPPAPFALEHPPQRLSAGRTTEPLARAAFRGYEFGVTPRAIAAKKFSRVGWALALAVLHRTRAPGLRRRDGGFLSFSRLPTLRAALSIPLALLPAFFPTTGRLAILPSRFPSPPQPGCGLALRAAIPRLGMGRVKGLLASLQQTLSLPRPMCPLTGPFGAASWMWAQGSCELPTAKPRTRSPIAPLRGAFSLPLSPLGLNAPFRLNAHLIASKRPLAGTTLPKPGCYGAPSPWPK
jgi:hypothetical protein